MVFSSPIFLFMFLPLFLAVYFLAPRSVRNAVIIAASLLFYSWGEAKLVVVMIASTLADFLCALVIANGSVRRMWSPPPALEPGAARHRSQRLALIASLSVNVGILAFFKYANWGIDNLVGLLRMLGWEGTIAHSGLAATLPLGISFYTFQSMSYTIDVYRGQAQATRHLLNYATLITKFPLLIAGPIIRYADVAKQLVTRVITVEKFAYGIRRFTVGLGKKVLLANTLAVPADAIFALSTDHLTFGLAWLGVISYAMQIYFDFSGYSDMAIGLGHMLGFTFLENFNYPYISRSIREFWCRWHISLSTWFRDYLYIPLGGNRRGSWRTAGNLLLVFFITGLWHGASWTFVVWGLWHGTFLLIERIGRGRWLERWWVPLRVVYALLVVMVGWVFFRAGTIGQAGQFIRAMFGGAVGSGVVDHASLYFNAKVAVAAVIGLMAATPLLRWFTLSRAERLPDQTMVQASTATWRLMTSLSLGLIFLFVVMQLASGTHNPFIYFRF